MDSLWKNVNYIHIIPYCTQDRFQCFRDLNVKVKPLVPEEGIGGMSCDPRPIRV